MKQYAPAHIRNVVILGHQDSGKTILAEALLYSTGAIARVGKIEDGNTTMDFSPEEITRQISIHSGVAFCELSGTKINIIDTPGYEDFVGEALYAIDVVESAIVAIRSDHGVEVGTERMWGFLREHGLPAMFVVNKMDKEHADFDNCLEQVREAFGNNARPFQIPIGSGDTFKGVVDLVANKAYEFGDGKSAKEIDIPDDLKDRASELRRELIETAAESDEALMEKYLETEELTDEEFLRGLVTGVRSGDIFPVFCAAAANAGGAKQILDAVAAYLPSPEGMTRSTEEEGKEVTVEPGGPLAAYVFKNVSDSHVGDMLYFRVFSGKMEAGHDLYNTTHDHAERPGQIVAPRGKGREEMGTCGAGDIGAVVKLKNTKIGDTLTEKGTGIKFKATELPRPSIFSAILPATKGDDEKMGTGLHRMHDEDPAFEVKVLKETRQTLIAGQGELHLDIIVGKLKERFGVGVVLEKPRIPYKETVTRKAESQGRHKKQSGGRGQFGDVWLRLEPVPRGDDFEFVNAIVGGVVPGKFIPAVQKGVVATMERGVIAGYQMVDVKVTLYDGSYHSVDSSEQAFKTAASIGFKAAVKSAGPVILEPIMLVKVKVAEEFMGDVMGDLSGRRGRIQGTEAQGKFTMITAMVPQSELYRYSTTLRSMTQGRGSHAREFSHYEQVPPDQQQKIIEESKQEAEK